MKFGCVMLVLLLLSAACHGAAEMEVNCMLVGKQVLQVSDTRQLTLRANGRVIETYVSPDGKYVVYLIADQRGEGNTYECRLAKVSTGKTMTIMSRVPPDEQAAASKDGWSLDDSPCIAWSPDSSMFALQATHYASETAKKTEQQFIAIFSASGASRKALPLGPPTEESNDHAHVSRKLLFTPDSHQILAALLIPDLSVDERIHRLDPALRLFDVGTGRSRDLSAPKLTPQNAGDSFLVWSLQAYTVGWSSDGALLLVLTGDGQVKLHKVSLTGSADEVLTSSSFTEVWSSDGAFAISQGRGLSIRAQQTEKPTPLIVAADVAFAGWAPNNRMLLYTKKESMGDVSKSRKRDFTSLWLSTIDPARPDSVCIALDVEGVPSASRGCGEIAYVCQGQLYVAELTLREPTISEKLATGLPLTEDETKLTMLVNAKQIGLAMLMYGADNKDSLPPAGSVSEALGDYIRDKSLFLRPGGQENVFRFVDPGVKTRQEIAKPSETIIGELDAGYGWTAALYADGHVAARPKQ